MCKEDVLRNAIAIELAFIENESDFVRAYKPFLQDCCDYLANGGKITDRWLLSGEIILPIIIDKHCSWLKGQIEDKKSREENCKDDRAKWRYLRSLSEHIIKARSADEN